MEVEGVIRLPSTLIMLKLRLKSPAMATSSVGEGLAICHQYMQPKYVEREIYVKVTPCNNGEFGNYNHQRAYVLQQP